MLADAIEFQQRTGGPSYQYAEGLEFLYLDSNVIGDNGAAAIAKIVGKNAQNYVPVGSLSVRASCI